MTLQPTLLIIAAGMGSRYGGLKQIDPVGPNGEIIIDYSIYDAVRAGFKKIVFVIRHSFEAAFREKIGDKLNGLVKTAYAYQELDACLEGGARPPAGRQKPWGTGHAILVARQAIREPFAVINADDYYGIDAYRVMADWLKTFQGTQNPDYAMVGYTLKNTLSDYGKVSRGVCGCSSDLYLTGITERTGISRNGDGADFIDEHGQKQHLTGDEIVSMNLWGFAPDIFHYLQQQFNVFCERHIADQHEFYIPSAVDSLIRNGQKRVKILRTNDTWFGVTYRQDKAAAQSCIRHLIKQQVYPEKIWPK